jgi:hypothetical protein
VIPVLLAFVVAGLAPALAPPRATAGTGPEAARSTSGVDPEAARSTSGVDPEAARSTLEELR